MSQEIYYTSAPEGLKRGTSGFCTVAASDNIPRALWDRLETLSAYRHVEGAGSAASNPTSFAHWVLTVTGKSHHVISRICDSGVDHTQRTNAFAHHIVVDPAEMEAAIGGPAWLLQQPGAMSTQWDGRVGAIAGKRLPAGDGPPDICRAWADTTGDAGWGGVLADLFAKTPLRPVCILFAPGQDLLPLMAESIALLPRAARWNVTFNTYFTSMPTSATCLWRCCLAGTPAADVGLRYAANGLVLNLADRSHMPSLPEGPYVNMARTGTPVESPRQAAKPAPLKPAPASQKPSPADAKDEAQNLLDDSTFDFADSDVAPPPATTTQQPAFSFSADVDDIPAPRARKGGPAVPARMFRRADEALEEAERQAGMAAQRRRKQVIMLFVGALAAIAAGMALVFILGHNSAPPPLPTVVTTKPAVRIDNPLPPEPSVNTNPATPVPQTTVAVAPTKPAEAPTVIPPPPAIIYPAVVTALAALERPNVGTGIGEREQTILFRGADLNPAAVSSLRLILPIAEKSSAPAAPSNNAIYSCDEGTLTAKSESKAGIASLSLLWKGATDTAPAEIASISWAAARPALQVQWHANRLLGKPAMFNIVYWILQNASFELDTHAPANQRVILKPFASPQVDLGGAKFDFKWPVSMPDDATITAVGMPEGWHIDSYVDWDSKTKAADRTPANALHVLKFKKGDGPADPIFWITFHDGLMTADCNFAKQFQDHENDFQTQARDLATKDAQIAQVKAENATMNAGVPPDMLNDRNQIAALVDAYKNAVAGYNALTGFDVSFEMPDGVRLATVHVQRAAKAQGK